MVVSYRHHRMAVLSFFFVNGFLLSNLMSRIPELKAQLNVSNRMLGLLLFGISVGSLLAMPVAGWLSEHKGSAKITAMVSIFFCLAIPFIPIFSNLWLVAICFFILGTATGSMDVTMNGQAVYVERLYDRPIMSSFHACFSIGMAVGAGSGAIFSRWQLPLGQHLGFMSAICFVVIWVASGYLVKNEFHNSATVDNRPKFIQIVQSVWILGLMAFCCMLTEGTLTDWSAIYMNKVMGQSTVTSAFAFGTFASGMTIGRIFGDTITARLGPKKLLLADTFCAILGLTLIIWAPGKLVVFIGMFLVGLGVATIVPIIFSKAGNVSGVPASVGISAVSSIGYFGFFVGPPTIGLMADLWGLRAAFGFTLVLLFILLFLIFRRADF
jgi:MFS family permease